MLAPTEILDPEQATELMLIAGFCLDKEDQVVIVRDEKTGIAALMALPRVLVATVEERYGDHYEFTTPLLRTRVCTEPTAWLYLANDLIYIKVYDPKLQMAEVVPIEDAADRDYLLARLTQSCDPNRYTVRLNLRTNDKSILRQYKNYFKRLQCE